MYVIVYNFDFHDKSGDILIEKEEEYFNNHTEYKYEIAETGSHGTFLFTKFNISTEYKQQFRKDMREFYETIGIPGLKCIIFNNEDELLHLLDNDPIF